MPGEPNQYVPPWRLPPEASEIQEPEAAQQPPQENNQVIQKPTGKPNFFKESFSSVIFVILFYWVTYLFINYQIRVSNSRGFSNFPLPLNVPEISDVDRIYLFLPFIGIICSIIIILISRSIAASGRKWLSRIALLFPAAIFIFAFVSASVNPCEEPGKCLGLAYIFSWGFAVVAAIYVAIFLNNLILTLLKKYSFTFTILIVFFLVCLITPFFAPKFLVSNFEDRVVKNSEVKITKNSFKKEEISRAAYDKAGGASRDCCSILEKRRGGEVVLKKLDGNKLLIGGPVQVDTSGKSNKDRADLYLEENGKLTNITKGLDFMALYTKIELEGYGTRPVMVSPSKDKIAFFKNYVSDPVLYVVSLDGSGVFMDENFCPWDCRQIGWATDGYIYVHVELGPEYIGKNRYIEKETYWKVTPPK